MLRPDVVCAYESMRAAELRLKGLGLGHVQHLTEVARNEPERWQAAVRQLAELNPKVGWGGWVGCGVGRGGGGVGGGGGFWGGVGGGGGGLLGGVDGGGGCRGLGSLDGGMRGGMRMCLGDWRCVHGAREGRRPSNTPPFYLHLTCSRFSIPTPR